MICKNPKCKKEFKPRRKDQKYCRMACGRNYRSFLRDQERKQDPKRHAEHLIYKRRNVKKNYNKNRLQILARKKLLRDRRKHEKIQAVQALA